jgi:Rrf2 family cysteine metabolism transcriptional repressor
VLLATVDDVAAMSLVSNKCEYALRAIFELARRSGQDPIKVQDIASAQGIPPRFLEIILVELKNGGFVLSKRGNNGGYILARPPREITVGQVIRLFQGDLDIPGQVKALNGTHGGDFAFSGLWERAQAAIAEVYDRTTFADLLQDELLRGRKWVLNYVI